MASPVVRFEVIGSNPDRLRRYYGDLFDWTFDTPSPVAEEVSQADSYGFLDLVRPATEVASAAAFEEARPMTATPSSMLACQMSKPRLNGPRASAALG